MPFDKLAAESFIAGFKFGRQSGRELTRREIETEYPAAHVDAFAQGNVDGVAEDHFRFSLVVRIRDDYLSLSLRDPKFPELLGI